MTRSRLASELPRSESLILIQNRDVIEGHDATTVTMTDVAQYAEFSRAFVEAVTAGKKAGQSIDDVANTWKVPEQFLKAGYAQPAVARPTQQRGNGVEGAELKLGLNGRRRESHAK